MVTGTPVTPSSDLPTPIADATIVSDEATAEPGEDSTSKQPVVQTKKLPKGKRFRPSTAQTTRCVS